MPAALRPHRTGLAGPVVVGAGWLLMALAPIIRGGNRHVALIGLEWLGLLVLLLLAALWLRPSAAAQADEAGGPPSRAVLLLALAPLWMALIQLTPLPASVWAALPGRADYLPALTALAGGAGRAAAWRPLSLTPDATASALLSGIPVVAAFLLPQALGSRQVTLLVRALVVFALAQAVLGLLQVGPFKALYFDAEFAGGALGTFANTNHFANHLAMTLPLAVLVLQDAAPWNHGHPGRSRRRLHHRAAALFWGLAMFVLLAAVLASGSRTGVLTALLVGTLAVVLLVVPQARTRSGRRLRLLGLVALLGTAAAVVGVEGFVSRFGSERLGADASLRWQILASSWDAARAFFPVGAGFGSYATVYPRYQPPRIGGTVDHAHNDYVQLLFEGGLPGLLLAGLAAWLLARRAWALWQERRVNGRWHDDERLQLCCALGLLALLLHSWVDFNLHIPANAMLAALLMGVFLRRPPANR